MSVVHSFPQDPNCPADQLPAGGRGNSGLPFRSPPPVALPPAQARAKGAAGDVGVNIAGIAEGRARILPLPIADAPVVMAQPAGDIVHAQRQTAGLPRPPSGPSLPRQTGLRLVPLAGFSWGRMTGQPVPRTRGDHALILIRHGQMRLNFPGYGRSDGGGAVYFLPAGTAFAAMPGPDAEGAVLLIARDLSHGLDPALPTATLIADAGPELPRLTQLLHDLDSSSASTRAMRDQALHCQLGLLAVMLSGLNPLRRSGPAASSGPVQIADPVLIERFLYLAGDRLGDGDTLSDLAAALGCTLAVLDRASIAVRGKRAIDLIYQLRHERAVGMLRDTQLPPEIIARRLGYASLAHFARAFVAETGRTPENYRDYAAGHPARP